MVTFEKNAIVLRIETNSPVQDWLNIQTGFTSIMHELCKRLDSKDPLDNDLISYLPQLQKEFLDIDSRQLLRLE